MRQLILWKSNGNNMKNSTVPSWSAPLTTSDILNINQPLSSWGKPKPLRHWRKQLMPRQKMEGYSRSSVGIPTDKPGNQVNYTSENCQNSLILKNNVERNPPINKCPDCIVNNNRIRSGMVQRIPYYNPHSSQYLYSNCKTYTQNIGIADVNTDTRKCNDVRKPLKVDDPHETCGKKIIYQPFGATSSSAQTKTVVYNNLTSYHINNYSANSLANQNFGHTEGDNRNSSLRPQVFEKCSKRHRCFKVDSKDKNVARRCNASRRRIVCNNNK